MIHLGIDPGASGAMAFISGSEMGVFDFGNLDALFYLISNKSANLPMKAVIERVSAFPGQGVTSMFGLGENYGRWIGRLEALGIPYDLVTPQRWKKAMFDSFPAPMPAPVGETPKEKQKRINERSKMLKEFSRQRAIRLFPGMAEYLKRKKDHNRAEAILLAAYCKKMAYNVA